ncbi:MAG: hypothetical protein DMH00_12750 [Acidobacteria bacterium]|nr:MAG: hypothetical protein DMH00_12750 [Acidobacteriota bacterium]
MDASCGGNDCSDSNPLVWSVPLEVTGLAVNTASSTELTWDSQDLLAGPETSFDLVSGPLPGGPVFSFSSSTCLQTGGGVAYSDGRADPLPAEGFWFLARARNSCGTGSFGSSQRDESTAPCP